jgi:poly(hydroxyalkanoate) depolymerase family esterase
VSSALLKAFLPTPPRRRRARRPPTPAAAMSKAVRSATKSLPPAVRALAPAVVPPARSKKRSSTKRRAAPAKPRSRTSSAGSGTAAAARPAAPGKGTWRSARFTGPVGTRAYKVYVPHGLRKTTRAPLVLALHGCTQNAEDFAVGTRLNELADKQHFLVVYPEQGVTHNTQRCWNWFRPAHQFRGQGEPAILAGIVRRVTQETSNWRIDPERVYVLGISAGGAMSVVLAATYPELFAAVGVHSAPPYRSASSPASALAAMHGRAMPPPIEASVLEAMPPMIIFQGTLDGTVSSGNGQRVADQWLAYHQHGVDRAGLDAVGQPRVTTSPPPRPTTARSRRGFSVSRWYAGSRKVLELWTVQGLGHAWSGGSSGGSYSDTRGPRATTEMWKFFAAQSAATRTHAVRR